LARLSNLGLPRWLEVVLFAAGVLIVPLVTLLALNWVIRGWWGLEVPGGLWGGLGYALVVFTIVAWLYLRKRLRDRLALPLAALASLVVILAVPAVVVLTREEEEERVGEARPLVSKLDLVILAEPSARAAGPPGRFPPAVPLPRLDLPYWDVSYSVGTLDGSAVRWQLLDAVEAGAALRAIGGEGRGLAGGPALRPDADRAIVAVVDRTPAVVDDPALLPPAAAAPGEVARWRAIVERLGLAPMAAFALLRTREEPRLARWSSWLAGDLDQAVSLPRLRSQTLTEMALRVVTEAPQAEEELALALKHRPLLFFDENEAYAQPVDIDDFLGSGAVELCGRESDSCREVRNARQLANGDTHLRLEVRRARRRPSAATPAASVETGTYYFRLTRTEDPPRIFLDYWWYLPFNPSPVATSLLCSPGFAILELTCFDHQSDWEGVTVVLNGRRPEAPPVQVNYAQHGDVVGYHWGYLERLWSDERYPNRRIDAADAGQHPLVFVAANSHASYPDICRRGCSQVAADIGEDDHDGEVKWLGNLPDPCAFACLRPLPTRARGTEPALWNAFEGPWGERNCIIYDVYCDVGDAPAAPSQQERYQAPGRTDLTIR
jgi:hypothetical protein